MIFTQYEEDLVGLGYYQTLMGGNSSVKDYIVKYSKQNGGFPAVDLVTISAKYNSIQKLVDRWTKEQSIYSYYMN